MNDRIKIREEQITPEEYIGFLKRAVRRISRSFCLNRNLLVTSPGK